MTYAIDDTNGRNCTTNDSQDTDGQVVKRRVLLFIYDVDGLDFSVEMNLLIWFVALSDTCSQRVSIFFTCLYQSAVFIEDNRNDFEMVVKINFFFTFGKVLDELSSGKVSLQVLDVFLYGFWFVGNREIKHVISQTEL